MSRWRYIPSNQHTSGRPFGLENALAAWETKYPDKGERIVVLQAMLYDCRKKGHPETTKNLEAMLASLSKAEGP